MLVEEETGTSAPLFVSQHGYHPLAQAFTAFGRRLSKPLDCQLPGKCMPRGIATLPTQRQLGHSTPVVTQVNASLVDEDVRRGVEMVWSAPG